MGDNTEMFQSLGVKAIYTRVMLMKYFDFMEAIEGSEADARENLALYDGVVKPFSVGVSLFGIKANREDNVLVVDELGAEERAKLQKVLLTIVIFENEESKRKVEDSGMTILK